MFRILGNSSTQLIVKTAPHAEIVHWGKYIGDVCGENSLSPVIDRAIPNSRLDKDVAITLAAEEGLGNFGRPGLEGNRDSHDWSPIFTTRSVDGDENTLRVHAEDLVAGLSLVSVFIFDDRSSVYKTRNILTNEKKDAYHVSRLALTIPLPDYANDVMVFNGRWIREFQTQRFSLNHGGYHQENRRGRTSHEYFPGAIIGESGFNETTGRACAFHLAWSGNHRIGIEVKSDGRRYFQAESLYQSGEITLAQGESLATPWLYMTFSADGLNAISHHFHDHIRTNILTFAKPRPIHLNTWEGIFFDHSPEDILRMVDKAAELGVERFIIDDGWFIGRNDDTVGLGDWFVDEEKYHGRLHDIVERVKSRGMEFGIWFEPEMINKNSNLYRSNPDWLLALPGYEQPSGRNQFVINLQNQDAWHYLLTRISAIVADYGVDYIKWDMNRELVQAAHDGRPAVYGQVQAYYRLLAALKERHPVLEIESCSSGGGRIDYEVLRYVDRFWVSDNNDALDRQTIQKGFSYFFPLCIMGAHIGVPCCHTTSRMLNDGFRGITALFGHMGLELDPLAETESTLATHEKYIRLNKSLRPLLHHGDLYRLDTVDPNRLVMGVVSKDKRQAVYMVSQLHLPLHALSENIRFAGLDETRRYDIRVLDIPDEINTANSQHTMKHMPDWIVKETSAPGALLIHMGLTSPILDPQSAMLILLEAS